MLPGQKYLTKFKKKAKFDKQFDFEKKLGTLFFSFVYIHVWQEFKDLKFSVHLHYCRESLTPLLSSETIQTRPNITLVPERE